MPLKTRDFLDNYSSEKDFMTLKKLIRKAEINKKLYALYDENLRVSEFALADSNTLEKFILLIIEEARNNRDFKLLNSALKFSDNAYLNGSSMVHPSIYKRLNQLLNEMELPHA